MQDTVTSRELFERMPTRPALAEPEVAAHKIRSYEDDSTDWAPSSGRAAAPDQPAQPARRRPVRYGPHPPGRASGPHVRKITGSSASSS